MRAASKLLKTDSKGRVQTPRERREMLLDEFEKTGTSAAAFARLVGVRYSTFAAWVHRRRTGRGAVTVGAEEPVEPAALKWVEATVDGGRCSGAIAALTVDLPGGARMEVADASQARIAAELLRALAAGGVGC